MSNIITDKDLCSAMINCEELSKFYEYDIDNEEFRNALEKVSTLKLETQKFSEETLRELNIVLNSV